MFNYSLPHTTERWFLMLRRVVEVVAVLLLALLATLINLSFGWVTRPFSRIRIFSNRIRIRAAGFRGAAKSSQRV